jgi:hypothetical protein
MSEVELLYFDIHGRGFCARMILYIGDVDYKNTIVTLPEFHALKPSK